MTEFTIDQFRAAARVTPTSNARGFLSGSRAIAGLKVTWESETGTHSLDVDTDNPDPVRSVFDELKANCIIRDCLKPVTNNPQTPTFSVGDVLFTTRGIISKRNWVCESISKGFAILTELQWSTDLELEKGCCRRTQLSMRRKIKNGLPYCAKLGEFKRRDDIVVIPTTTKP